MENINHQKSDPVLVRLLISCPDQPGIVSAVSSFLYEQGGNIVQSDQYSMDPKEGAFFIRIACELNSDVHVDELSQRFEPIAANFQMTFRFESADRKKRMAVFVSKEDHCLRELLWQQHSGDIDADIRMIVSNHPDAALLAKQFNVPFHHIPVTSDTKHIAESRQLELLAAESIDVIVLARYMQILSQGFAERFPHQIINIHHSFLPAFIGKNPYARAYARGVKLIGATAHYVTPELDEGPIIEQDVHRVDHRHDVTELKRIGRYVERTVLAKAVKWHLEDRILVYQNRTIVFS